MAITPHDSTGTTFAFGGTTFTVTSITYSITDQAAADALPRSTAVGYYGPLSLHEHNDHAYLSAAQAAHRALHDVELVDTTPASVVEDPW